VVEWRSFSYTDLGGIRIDNIHVIKNNIQHLMTHILQIKTLVFINILFNFYLLVSDYQSVSFKLHRNLECWREGHTCVLWYSFRVSCKSISWLTFFYLCEQSYENTDTISLLFLIQEGKYVHTVHYCNEYEQ
jgi:hypothetical protein